MGDIHREKRHKVTFNIFNNIATLANQKDEKQIKQKTTKKQTNKQGDGCIQSSRFAY